MRIGYGMGRREERGRGMGRRGQGMRGQGMRAIREYIEENGEYEIECHV